MTAISARRVSLAALAAIIIGMIATASAFATEPYMKVQKEGKVTTLAEGETRTQTIGLPAEGRLYLPAAGTTITIACTSAKGSGKIYNNYVGGKREEGRLKSASVTFEGCSVVGKSGCYIDGAIAGAGKITTNTLAARLGYQPGSSENIEAELYPESSTTFTTITLSECSLEGVYTIKGELVSGIGPTNTFLAAPVEGVVASSAVQELKTIEFPGQKEDLSARELKVGEKKVSVEGALELVLSGEELGYFNS
jgi:hypothetical protein